MDGADAWEVPPSEVATTPPAIQESGTPRKDDIPAGAIAVIKGSAFKIEGTTETQSTTTDFFTMSHYFAASAPVELKTSASLMETELEGQNAGGSVPLIQIKLASTSGPYRSFAKEPRPIDGKQVLQDKAEIGPGKYKLSIGYFKETAGAKRPRITINSVKFK